MRLSRQGQVRLVRFSYVTPLLVGIALLILALCPRFFYMLEGKPQSDISLFWLLTNTFKNCITFFRSEETRVPAEFYFSLASFTVCLLSWLCILLYAFSSITSALLTVLTWNGETSPAINNLKRCFRLLVPNRACMIVIHFLPILPALFPYILQGFYSSIMHLETPVYYYAFPDIIPVGILLCGVNALFLLSLQSQEELRMDLFRLYKTK